MSVGLVLISHRDIAGQMLATAVAALGRCPLAAQAMAIDLDTDPAAALNTLARLCARVDAGDGVLMMVDVFGATPFNIAKRHAERSGAKLVTGLNLPMLLRALNYPNQPLDQLAQTAAAGGGRGIVIHP